MYYNNLSFYNILVPFFVFCFSKLTNIVKKSHEKTTERIHRNKKNK